MPQPQYQAPGVYVVEVSSGNAPISGAGTSTAAFIGCFNYSYDPSSSSSSSAAPSSSSSAKAPASSSSSAAAPPASSSSSAAPPPASSSSSGLQDTAVGSSTSSSSSGSTARCVAPGVIVLCNNYTDFKTNFIDASEKPAGSGQLYLSQAVYGFFQNGGVQCYVVRIPGINNGDFTSTFSNFSDALASLEPIPGISQVAAPGLASATVYSDLVTHCQNVMGDRFAIIETPNVAVDTQWDPLTKMDPSDPTIKLYTLSDYIALYHPWIYVPNPDTSPGAPATVAVPPSGHIAGLYAQSDAARGVNKAPANLTIAGALGFTAQISQSQQSTYNTNSVNCLRNMNGSLMVWGARTLINQASPLQSPSPQMRYINARRFLNYLKDSLYAGLQWTVFEPNNPNLWANVIRNVNAFLKPLWAQGALLGATPAAAYYVKCDAENNPQPQLGTLYVEIGVAIVEPAEFVLISLSDWAGPPAQ